MTGSLERVRNIPIPDVGVFTADNTSLVDGMSAPTSISFDEPFSAATLNKYEGFHDLGLIPNWAEVQHWNPAASLRNRIIKPVGHGVFEIPAICRPLAQVIQLAAAFESAHGQVDVRKKSCSIILRNNTYHAEEEAQELHRDPPEPVMGRRQNVYSFATSHPTIFPDANEALKPLHLSCFTSASIHGRPAITLGDDGKSLRRVFVAIIFACPPEKGGEAPLPHALPSEPRYIRARSEVGHELSKLLDEGPPI